MQDYDNSNLPSPALLEALRKEPAPRPHARTLAPDWAEQVDYEAFLRVFARLSKPERA